MTIRQIILIPRIELKWMIKSVYQMVWYPFLYSMSCHVKCAQARSQDLHQSQQICCCCLFSSLLCVHTTLILSTEIIPFNFSTSNTWFHVRLWNYIIQIRRTTYILYLQNKITTRQIYSKSYLLVKVFNISMGTGKMMVEFFSAEIELRVWNMRYVNNVMADQYEAVADTIELSDPGNLVSFTGLKCQPFAEQAATLHFTVF